MDDRYIPGTNMPYTDSNMNAFSYIEPLISAAGGLSLSQVGAITGLEPSTVQNWVKRGWVSVEGKKYNEAQVARILIINATRGCLQLDGIALLLQRIQGSLTDTSDDLLGESELFNYLCRTVRRVTGEPNYDNVHAAAQFVTKKFEPTAERGRLAEVLTVLAMATISSNIARDTNFLLTQVLG
ncbi:MAG: DUF1836 domain-containing protein [Oscillospiraceae bacterium]|jgi:hypothetical protein|nr:DUF1836 domain-containing protein [Oscillospiraceae bacterium]